LTAADKGDKPFYCLRFFFTAQQVARHAFLKKIALLFYAVSAAAAAADAWGPTGRGSAE
jgi:hypothetical protein